MFCEKSQGPGVGNCAKEKERTKSKSLELTLSLIQFYCKNSHHITPTIFCFGEGSVSCVFSLCFFSFFFIG